MLVVRRNQYQAIAPDVASTPPIAPLEQENT